MYIALIYLDFLLRSAQNRKNVCDIHFWIWKKSKFIFLCPPFGPFWPAKYLKFWPKATDSDSSSYFSRK